MNKKIKNQVEKEGFYPRPDRNWSEQPEWLNDLRDWDK